jgi:hypothetical protein
MNPYQIGVQASSLHASYEFYFGKRKRHMPSIPFRAFHNALRILHSLDYHEVSFLTEGQWSVFRDNPYSYFMSTSTQNAVRIWEAIQKRQPQELKE